jgi:two-component system, NarL family, nitrate/nitrite response regulator NarL
MRILVVSDVRVVREGLHSVLAQQDGVDIISAVDMRHAKHQSAQLNPDIVLFDAARLESIGIARDLVAASPHTKVVAFGVRESDAGVLALAAAGMAGCVRDSAASADMVRVLEQVLSEALPCSRRPQSSGHRHLARLSEGAGGNDQAYTAPLSPRELQIAQLIESGLSNHLHNMCEKLKVHRRGEIAARIRPKLGAGTTFPASAWQVKAALEVG